MSFDKGDTVGRYRLDREIGSGGFGVVVSATDDNHRSWALKFATPNGHALLDAEIVSDRELQRLHGASFLHAALPIVDHGEVQTPEGPTPWYARRRVEGSVYGLVRECTIDERISAALDIAMSALWYAELGVVHGDYKPPNFIFEREPDGGLRTWVADFSPLVRDGAGTRPNLNWGYTPGYVCDEPRPSAKSDAFAIAVCVFEVLTGGLPTPCIAAATPIKPFHLSEGDRRRVREALPTDTSDDASAFLLDMLDRGLSAPGELPLGGLVDALRVVARRESTRDSATDAFVALELEIHEIELHVTRLEGAIETERLARRELEMVVSELEREREEALRDRLSAEGARIDAERRAQAAEARLADRVGPGLDHRLTAAATPTPSSVSDMTEDAPPARAPQRVAMAVMSLLALIVSAAAVTGLLAFVAAPALDRAWTADPQASPAANAPPPEAPPVTVSDRARPPNAPAGTLVLTAAEPGITVVISESAATTVPRKPDSVVVTLPEGEHTATWYRKGTMVCLARLKVVAEQRALVCYGPVAPVDGCTEGSAVACTPPPPN